MPPHTTSGLVWSNDRIGDVPDGYTGSISYRPGHQLKAISSLHSSAISRNWTFKAIEKHKTQIGRSPHWLSMSHMLDEAVI